MAQADSPNMGTISPKMGRPTKLTQKLIKKAEDYYKNHFDKYGDPFPSAAGLAVELGISRSTLYKWADENVYFSDMLDDISVKQERLLLSKGITGEFTAPITKLVLAKHDYSDKVSQDVTSSDGSMKPTVIELVGVPSENAAEDS
jgi:hypothetical protein